MFSLSLTIYHAQGFEEHKAEPGLDGPQCQASILCHPGTGVPARDVFIFRNLGTQIGRTNG